MNILFKCHVLVFCILFCFFSVKSQKSDISNDDPKASTIEILNKARKKIYKEKTYRNIDSIFLSISGESSSQTKLFENKDKFKEVTTFDKINNKYHVNFPSLIRVVETLNTSSFGLDVKAVRTSIINGDFYKNKTNTFIDGQKFNSNELDNVKASTEMNLEELKYHLLREILPILLNNPLEKQTKFSFIGKANIANQIAFILEFDGLANTSKQRKIRYFIDSKSFLLLMIIDESLGDEKKTVVTRYFSGQTLMSGLLIPTKIKEEIKISSMKPFISGKQVFTQSQLIKITNFTIDEFKINQKFSSDIFNIKK